MRKLNIMLLDSLLVLSFVAQCMAQRAGTQAAQMQRAAASSDMSQKRKIFAWASPKTETIAQLRNETWKGIFDGVHATCGVTIVTNKAEVEMVANETVFRECASLKSAIQSEAGEFHVWTNGVPQILLENKSLRSHFFESAVNLAHKHGIQGYSMDDETDCAPRSVLTNFTLWAEFASEFADALHAATPAIQLSAAVQAMFGIQDVPYKPSCTPHESPGCSQACNKPPWEYTPDPRVGMLMSNSSMDRWIEMDTYYFSTQRYLDALDWYASAVSQDRLGIAVMNRDDITEDGYVARFHALDKSGADWLNIFMLPASDAWLPYLRRWKTRCAACPNRGALSCYEPAANCAATGQGIFDVV